MKEYKITFKCKEKKLPKDQRIGYVYAHDLGYMCYITAESEGQAARIFNRISPESQILGVREGNPLRRLLR